MKLIKNINSLVTVSANGKLHKSGREMQDINEIKNGAVFFTDKVEWVGTTEEATEMVADGRANPIEIINLKGKTVLPGFVDSHTHYVFSGNRSNEFARRLRGVTYQQIAEEGGGILTTMKATRAASIDELTENGYILARNAMSHGTTALEIKSGYGLTIESEIKQLYAIRKLQQMLPLHISSTFMGAHDFPPEYKTNRDGYVDLIINEMLPRIAEENLAEYCDAFIDKGFYTVDQGRKIFQAAIEYGFKIKAHCDELADVSAAKLAAELKAISADHLLFISDEGIDALRNSGTVATLLPGTAYFIRMPYAPARKIIDEGGIVALATDTNPGSCYTENMLNILSLAVINMNMTAEEAISAATINGAKAINQSHKMGSLEVGKDANFIIANCDSYADIFYHFAINPIESTWINGNKVADNINIYY